MSVESVQELLEELDDRANPSVYGRDSVNEFYCKAHVALQGMYDEHITTLKYVEKLEDLNQILLLKLSNSTEL